MSRGIESLLNSAPKVHISTGITEWQLAHIPEYAKLHGMHKPYSCDFNINKDKLAENTSSIVKED